MRREEGKREERKEKQRKEVMNNGRNKLIKEAKKIDKIRKTGNNMKE